MNTPIQPPASTPPSAPPSRSRAVWSLVLGILGILCCGFLAPVAWYLGNEEKKAVEAGLAPTENRGLAMAGMILGIIGTILLVLSIVWILFFGGMEMINMMMEGAR